MQMAEMIKVACCHFPALFHTGHCGTIIIAPQMDIQEEKAHHTNNAGSGEGGEEGGEAEEGALPGSHATAPADEAPQDMEEGEITLEESGLLATAAPDTTATAPSTRNNKSMCVCVCVDILEMYVCV